MRAFQGSSAGRAAGRKENRLRKGMLKGHVHSERVGHGKQCHIACFLTHLKMSIYCAQCCWPSPACVVFTMWSTDDTHSTHRTLDLFSPVSEGARNISQSHRPSNTNFNFSSLLLCSLSPPFSFPSCSFFPLFLRAEGREGSSLQGLKLSQS